MAKKLTKTQKRTKRAFHEMKKDPPGILKHTARKFGKKRAQKQRVAIALAKGRKRPKK